MATRPCDIIVDPVYMQSGVPTVTTYPLQTAPDVQKALACDMIFKSALCRATPSKRGDLYPHQELFKRLMMEYDRILLLAEPGTGKTLSFFAVTEKLVRELGAYKHAYVFEKGGALLEATRRQLVFKAAPPDVFEMPRVGLGTYMRTLNRIRSNAIAQYYTFDTYTRFANETERMTDGDVRLRFSDCIFVLDEAHNIVNSDGRHSSRYYVFERIFSIADNIKVILSTATPMVNRVSELPPLMNLILPPSRKFPAEWQYTPGDVEARCRGFVSYVESVDGGDVRVIDMGEPRHGLTLFESEMTDLQRDVYSRHAPPSEFSPDTNTGSIYNNAFQTSMFVWPDGSFGGSSRDGGFSTYVEAVDGAYHFRTVPRGFRQVLIAARARSFKEWIAPAGGPPSERVERIRELSCKFASLIQIELEEMSGDGTSFVYTESKFGGGAILLGLCFEAFGFERYVPGGSRVPTADGAARFALLTTEPEVTRDDQRDILETFNSPENAGGRLIKVVIGSLVTRDGLDLYHCVRVHLMSPPWTESGAKQAVSRAFRAASHNSLAALRRKRAVEKGIADPDNGHVSVRVYRHAAVAAPLPSIDYVGYKIAAEKELFISKAKSELVAGAIDRYISASCAGKSQDDEYWTSESDVRWHRTQFEETIARGRTASPYTGMRASHLEVPVVSARGVVYPLVTTCGITSGTVDNATRAAAMAPRLRRCAATPVYLTFNRSVFDAAYLFSTEGDDGRGGVALTRANFALEVSQKVIVGVFEDALVNNDAQLLSMFEKRYPASRYVRRTTVSNARAKTSGVLLLPGVADDARVIVHLVYVMEKRQLRGEYSFSKAAGLFANDMVLDTLRYARVYVEGEGLGWRYAVIPQEAYLVFTEKAAEDVERPLLHGIRSARDGSVKIVDRRRQPKSRGTVCTTANVFNIVTDILALNPDPDLNDVLNGLVAADDETYAFYIRDVERVFDVEKTHLDNIESKRSDDGWRRRVARLFDVSRPLLCAYLVRLMEDLGIVYDE